MTKNKPEFDSAPVLPSTVVRPKITPYAPARPFKRPPEKTEVAQPSAYLNVQIDGRETSYFEWLGAGVCCADGRGAVRKGRLRILSELRYGFGERFFYLRVDLFSASLSELRDCEFRITLHGSEELRLLVAIEHGQFAGCLLNTEDLCILGLHEFLDVAFEQILEVAIGRRLVKMAGETTLTLDVALWRDGIPVDFLPTEAPLEVTLGTDAFAWNAQ